ncbi:hypothetical protein [Methylobacterium sp. WSM2598]|uniref:hypothetical protein n=1 Tax=Methylobacterium sp. WSM2598 TaxID=398261 RepID=UPI0012F65BF2|nr:hypothetical protein [Methylobacterium sp. WSM2598]
MFASACQAWVDLEATYERVWRFARKASEQGNLPTQKPISQMHDGGYSRVSYCHPEFISLLHRFAWQSSSCVAGSNQRFRTVLGVCGSACALATGAFWSTMLMAPLKSGATYGVQPEARCVQLDHVLRPWFDREVVRRARVSTAAGQTEFNSMLLPFQAAHTQQFSRFDGTLHP